MYFWGGLIPILIYGEGGGDIIITGSILDELGNPLLTEGGDTLIIET